uniref:Uncharacterized protein n=1 Tax=Ditylenchus dipsaci TaxID=166011 RepID=A0A915ENH2_9BILA
MLSSAFRRIAVIQSISCSCQRASSTSTVEGHSQVDQPMKKLKTRLNERHFVLAEGGIPRLLMSLRKKSGLCAKGLLNLDLPVGSIRVNYGLPLRKLRTLRLCECTERPLMQ